VQHDELRFVVIEFELLLQIPGSHFRRCTGWAGLLWDSSSDTAQL